MSAAVAGGVIAIYQFGYGIAAFGVGPLVDRGVSLSLYGCTAGRLDGWTAVAAGAMALLSFAVAGRQALSAGIAPTACGRQQIRQASRQGGHRDGYGLRDLGCFRGIPAT